jgi:hypothetical protein
MGDCMDLQRIKFFKELITDELAEYINDTKPKEKLPEPVDIIDRQPLKLKGDGTSLSR